ncbi:MAG: DUF29 domain-containing protein [Pseudomonadota bacterium]
MATNYDTDVVAWANEQARLIRSGCFDQLDLEHIAEEIEDVGKSENRELVSRMAVLLAHLLKWQYQPARRSKSWQYTIKTQRVEVAFVLREAPSLKARFSDPEWSYLVWSKAKLQAENETSLDVDVFPDSCPWSLQDVLSDGWLPHDL